MIISQGIIMLKTLFLLLVVMVFITSCDAPIQKRYSADSGQTSSPSVFTALDEPTNDSLAGNKNPYDSSLVEVASEVDHCSWARDGVNGFMSLSSHLSPNEDSQSAGAYSLCQSRSDQHIVYFQIKNPIEDAQICFIPTYQMGTSTTYIGEPRCIFIVDSMKVYRIELYRNRPGFSHLPITGAMVMKDKAYAYPAPYNQTVLSPDAFLFCNQQLIHAVYPNPSYCASFKQAGHYIYQQF